MAAANGKTEEKASRTKKGEGPFVISFIDADNKETPRVPNAVHAVKVVDKSKNEKLFTIGELSPAVKERLAASGLRNILGAGARNGANDDGSNVLDIVSKLFENVKEGKLYAAREGGKSGAPRGRQFDYQLWIDVGIRTKKLRREEAPTDAQIANSRLKLEAMTPADRNAKIKQWKDDPFFALAHKEITAERARASVKKNVTQEDAAKYNATSELF